MVLAKVNLANVRFSILSIIFAKIQQIQGWKDMAIGLGLFYLNLKI